MLKLEETINLNRRPENTMSGHLLNEHMFMRPPSMTDRRRSLTPIPDRGRSLTPSPDTARRHSMMPSIGFPERRRSRSTNGGRKRSRSVSPMPTPMIIDIPVCESISDETPGNETPSKESSDSDEEEEDLVLSTVAEDVLYCLSPLMQSMAILGLFYGFEGTKRHVLPGSVLVNKTFLILHKLNTFLTCHVFTGRNYAAFIMLLLWFNFARSLATFFITGTSELGITTSRIVYAAWFLQCALNCTIMFRSCYRKRLRLTLLAIDQRYIDDNCTPTFRRKQLYEKCVNHTASAWFYALFYIVLCFFAAFGPLEDANKEFSVLFEPFPQHIMTKCACLFLQVLDSCAWVFPISIYILICHIIGKQFENLSIGFHKTCQDNPNKFPPKFEAIRQHHKRLCEQILLVDKDFRFLCAASVFTNLPIIGFLVYKLLTEPFHPVPTSLRCYWLMTNLANIFCMQATAAWLNGKVHYPMHFIYDVKAKDMGAEQVAQLHLFMHKLTDKPIGITLLNIFVITKKVILMVSALVITFLVILLLFKLLSMDSF